jgi:hypothetical protein
MTLHAGQNSLRRLSRMLSLRSALVASVFERRGQTEYGRIFDPCQAGRIIRVHHASGGTEHVLKERLQQPSGTRPSVRASPIFTRRPALSYACRAARLSSPAHVRSEATMTAIAAQSHRAQPAPFGARCPVASLVALDSNSSAASTTRQNAIATAIGCPICLETWRTGRSLSSAHNGRAAQ